MSSYDTDRLLGAISQQLEANGQELVTIRIGMRDYAEQIAQLLTKIVGQLETLNRRLEK